MRNEQINREHETRGGEKEKSARKCAVIVNINTRIILKYFFIRMCTYKKKRVTKNMLFLEEINNTSVLLFVYIIYKMFSYSYIKCSLTHIFYINFFYSRSLTSQNQK